MSLALTVAQWWFPLSCVASLVLGAAIRIADRREQPESEPYCSCGPVNSLCDRHLDEFVLGRAA